MNKGVPLLISWFGCNLDAVSTQVGLSMGFYETHMQYNPVIALLIFVVANIVLAVSLPDTKKFNVAKCIFAAFSFFGVVNNALVILGIFGGIII